MQCFNGSLLEFLAHNISRENFHTQVSFFFTIVGSKSKLFHLLDHQSSAASRSLSPSISFIYLTLSFYIVESLSTRWQALWIV